jgi:hypothetical protein
MAPSRYASLTEDQIIIRIVNARRRIRQATSIAAASADRFAIAELNAVLAARQKTQLRKRKIG